MVKLASIQNRLAGGALALLTLWNLAAHSAPGDVDPSFNASCNSRVSAVQIQSNGQILAGVTLTNVNGLSWTGIVRFWADGSLDTAYVVDTGASNSVYCIAIQLDEKVIIGGNFSSVNGTNRSGIARLNPDGSLDMGFNPVLGPVSGFRSPPASINCVAIQTNGALLVVGSFSSVNGTKRNSFARLNADGSLDSGFDPTTDLKRNAEVLDPLDDFLFHEEAGHCEYFASAAVILLRSAGVPTRYINGFLGGEWNDFGKHITVRENRAHSWAEAYVGTFGWMPVDATPVAGRISRMGRLRQMFDSVELFWNRWILQYDASRQIDLAKRLGRGLGMERPSGTRRRAWKPDLKVAGGVAAAAVLAVVLWRLRRRVRRTQVSRPARSVRGRPPIFRLYARTLDRLAGSGWPRGPAETPDEYAARLAKADVPGAEVMRRLTHHYAAARYGDREIADDVLAELTSSAGDVARARPAAPAPRA